MRPSLLVRSATLVDLEPVCEMLWALTQEERSHLTTLYPRIEDSTKDEILALFRSNYLNFDTHTEVVDDTISGQYAGFASATLIRRPTGSPKTVLRLDTIYLAPGYRASFGHLSTCKQMVGAIYTWGRVAARAFSIAPDDLVIEGAYMPGGPAERLWTAAGLRPYLSLCAWVNDDGTPNTKSMKRYIGGSP